MDHIFELLEERLSAFEASVTKDLEEMRQCKAEMRHLSAEFSSKLKKGRYERDDERIILSAPEIIIGNVDSEGMLLGGSSVITVRGTDVAVQAAGDAGKVETRAASIRQVAEDPGDDGREHVVGPVSEVVSHARQIIVQSEDADGTFALADVPGADSGVFIHADEQVDISATATAESREERIQMLIESLESRKEDLMEELDLQKESFKETSKEIDELMDDREKLLKDEESIITTFEDIEWLNTQIDEASTSLAQTTAHYAEVLSLLGEVHRQIKSLKDQKAAIIKGDEFKQQSTGASVAITGETISLISADGEGNLRDTPESGITMKANKVSVASVESDGQLKPEGRISLQAKHVEVATAGETDQQWEDDGTLTAATYTTEGDFTLKSQNIAIEGVDYEIADKQYKEKQLTADSKIKLRAKTIEVSTEGSANIEVDAEGKVTKATMTAEGDVIVKSKTVTVASADYDVEGGEAKEKALTKDGSVTIKAEKTDLAPVDAEGKLLAGSSMSLVAEKMFVGAKSKDVRSKLLQAASDSVGLFADTTLEAQQGDGKAVLQLDGGNASVGGGKTHVFGATTINANTEIKGEMKAPKATIDIVEVKSAFKTPNIQDGIAAGAAGGGGSLSAKLKEEEQA
jgi:hypothetical protein